MVKEPLLLSSILVHTMYASYTALKTPTIYSSINNAVTQPNNK